MMTPRIRSVKPELFSHEALFEAELFYKLPLRLAYIALFTCCDCEGRFRWQPRRLKLDMLPYDDVDISRVLEAFIECGFVKKYEYQGEYYGCIPSWSRHQKVNHKEADSVLPSIADSLPVGIPNVPKIQTTTIEELSVSDACSTGEASVNDACPTGEASLAHAARACPGGREEEEKRKGREEEGKGSLVASKTRRYSDLNAIQTIFEHWKTVMHHPNANLENKRKAIIEKALQFGYSAEQLCNAITGCSYTPHNMGDNEQGQRYDGLHVILRDGDQIDRFIRNFHYPPQPATEANRRSHANTEALKGWMFQKMAEAENYAEQ